jgi:hypothetical protein
MVVATVAVRATGHAQTNSWISPTRGFWDDYTKWSLEIAPTNTHSVYITNDLSKTVTIDSVTSGDHPDTMSVSNLSLFAPAGATNILELASAGTNAPLLILDTFSVSAGGLLRLTESAVWMQAVTNTITNGVLNVDGTVVLNNNGLLMADSGMYVGVGTNATGLVLLNGGELFLTNGLSSIGVNGSGQMIISNGTVMTTDNSLLVGLGSGSQGALTVAAGNYISSPYGRLVLGMETGATGVVSVTGGNLVMTNSFIALIGGAGSGQLNLSGGTNTLGPTEIGGNPGSAGTLTVAGGVNNVQGALFVGASLGATGAVWMTGGQLIATNWTTYVGVWGFGAITVSNGNWLGDAIIVGSRSNSQGTVTVAGGSVTLLSKLELGNWPNSVGVVQVTDGSLAVTNASGTASLVVGGPAHPVLPSTICDSTNCCNSTNCSCVLLVPAGAGTGVLNQNGGTVTVDRLLLTNGANSVYNFSAGTLQTKATTVVNLQTFVVCGFYSFVSSTIVTNPQTFVVGDGIQPATFHLLGGVHSFVNDLRIRTNAFLTGCGTITGNVLVEGTVLADCGGTLTFTGVVTNNAVLRAVNGTVLEFYAPVVNNGLIDVINGNTNFHAGVVNNGIILDANGDYDGDGMSNLQEYLAGTDPTNSASALRITSILPEGNDILMTWSAVTNKTYVVQVATNSSDGSYTNAFSDLATVIVPAAPAITETNYLDVGAATNDSSRFYRIRLATPP